MDRRHGKRPLPWEAPAEEEERDQNDLGSSNFSQNQGTFSSPYLLSYNIV